jgi:hypothetical protein
MMVLKPLWSTLLPNKPILSFQIRHGFSQGWLRGFGCLGGESLESAEAHESFDVIR